MSLQSLIGAVDQYRKEHPNAAKQEIASAISRALGLKKYRSVFASDEIAVRFSSSAGPSFSNVVLSLSALRPFDNRPFVVVLIRPDTTEYLLANTTLLKKISHSSRELRVDNVRGSFLGHDIMRELEGVQNSPEKFDALFAMHQEFSWDENLERLVEATGNIVGTGRRFEPSVQEVENILNSPSLSSVLCKSSQYAHLKEELDSIVSEKAGAILKLAEIDNVNLRGNQIEQLITGGINEHNLADLNREIDGIEISLEIKTKLMDRASSPKAYNVDKALATLSKGNSVIAFCFVGIDVSSRRVTSSAVSIFDQVIIGATRIQHHWAGRNSRGVTQLTGDFTRVFLPNYEEDVQIDEAKAFIQGLLDL